MKEAMVRLNSWMCAALLGMSLVAGCSSDPPASQSAGQPDAPPPPPKPETGVAEIVHVSLPGGAAATGAQVLAAGATAWAPVGKAILRAGDQLHAPAEVTLMVHLGCGASVALNGETTVRLDSCDAITLSSGEIWLERPQPNGAGRLTLAASVGEVILEGAVGSARVDGTTLAVSLVSGKARVQGRGGDLLLRAGESATVTATNIRQDYIKEPEGLVSWTQQLREVIANSVGDPDALLLPEVQGLGTLVAHLPGRKDPLPFEIISQEVQVNIQDHMALTKVEQEFRNPTDRVVEGAYKFPLPDGAKLTRYDMEVGGRMMQGEIVPKKQGRKIMKKVIAEFLERMRPPKDPALVEWESGNTFKTRIFPIKARETKRIVLGYLHPLSGSAGKYRYQLPIAQGSHSAVQIPELHIAADIGVSGAPPKVRTPLYAAAITPTSPQSVAVRFQATAFKPQADFVIDIETPAHPESTLATYGKAATPPLSGASTGWGATVTVGPESYFMLQMTPSFPRGGETTDSDWILMMDTSESRFGPESAIQNHLAASLIDAMGPDDRVKLVTFDSFAKTMHEEWQRPSEALKTQITAHLNDIEPGGASNLEGAIREAAAQVPGARPVNLVLISDGAATLGEREAGALVRIAAALLNAPSISLSAVGVGASVDRVLLENLAKRCRGHYFNLSSGEDLLAAAVRIITGLRGDTLQNPVLRIEGVAVEEVLPDHLPNLVSGQTLTVTGRYRGQGSLEATLSGTLAGSPWQKRFAFTVGQPSATNTFIPLFHAANQLDALTLSDAPDAERRAVEVSKRFGIASRYTSFIVLENDAMYREYRVQQTGDRLHWEGDAPIEYEAPEMTLEVAEEVDAALLGDGDLLVGAPAAIASDTAGGGASSRGAPPAMAKARSGKRSVEMESGPNPFPSRREPIYVPPKPSYVARIWRPKATPTAAAVEQATLLDQAVAREPLVRRHRRDLVRHLIRNRMIIPANGAVTDWLVADRTNPEPHLYAAEVKKLLGDMEAAVRHFGSAIELAPEDTGTMGLLAGHFEATGAWAKAYPFRAALAGVAPKHGRAAAQRAVVAAMAGDLQTARQVAQGLVTSTSTGYHKLKGGVRLPKRLGAAITALADLGNLPGDFYPFGGKGARGRVVITLEAEPDAGVTLWVKKDRDGFLGGIDDDAHPTANPADPRQMSLVVHGNGTGLYRIQVVCLNPNGCSGARGTLHIKAFDNRRSIPFSLEESTGVDLAIMRISKAAYRY